MSAPYPDIDTMMIMQIVYDPVKTFDRLKHTDVLYLAVFLMLIRWSITPITTVVTMYRQYSPMFLTPPFGIDERTYRYYEVFWYGFYGFFMMLVIAYALVLITKHLYHNPEITFRRSFEIVALCFFTPWVPSVPGDYVLLLTVNAHPAFLIPFHISVLTWSCSLIALGFHGIYKTSLFRSLFIGFVAGGIFMAMGALLIR